MSIRPYLLPTIILLTALVIAWAFRYAPTGDPWVTLDRWTGCTLVMMRGSTPQIITYCPAKPLR